LTRKVTKINSNLEKLEEKQKHSDARYKKLQNELKEKHDNLEEWITRNHNGLQQEQIELETWSLEITIPYNKNR